MDSIDHLTKIILSTGSYKNSIASVLGMAQSTNANQHSYVQENLTSPMALQGCCAFLSRTRGYFRVYIPNNTLKVSKDSASRWIHELNELFGMNIEAHNSKTVEKLVQQQLIPSAYFDKNPDRFEFTLKKLLEMYKRYLIEFFPRYKELVLKHVDSMLSVFRPELYIDQVLIANADKELVLEILENMELRDVDTIFKSVTLQDFNRSNFLSNFITLVATLANETRVSPGLNVVGSVNTATIPTIFSPCGLLIDTELHGSWLTTKTKQTKRIVLAWKYGPYPSGYTNYMLTKNGVQYNGGSIPGMNVNDLLTATKEWLELPENKSILDIDDLDFSLGKVYKIRMINKHKLIPHTLIRALWTPTVIKAEGDLNFIDIYFKYRDQYPHLDPYFLLNLVGCVNYRSNYGVFSGIGKNLYINPNVPVPELIQKVRFKMRPQTPASVVSFYNSVNNIDGAKTIPQSINTLGLGEPLINYFNRVLKYGLELYDI